MATPPKPTSGGGPNRQPSVAPKPTVPVGNKPPPPVDPLAGLTGANRDVAAAVLALFKTYGLESLAGKIVQFVQQGMGADAISLELQNTAEYKQRFAANAARLKAGLPALSPAEYISTERAYRQVMSAAGLPPGFYDQTSDFQKFLEQDVSPTEVQGRVQVASEALNQAPRDTMDFFKQFYSTGDMIAYALDPGKALPLINERIKAAEAAAYAKASGVSGLDQATAESVGRSNATLSQLQSGMSFIGQEQQNVQRLGEIYGQRVTAGDLAQEVFNQDAAATAKRRTLSSKERASFSGGSGQGNASLSHNDAGSV